MYTVHCTLYSHDIILPHIYDNYNIVNGDISIMMMILRIFIGHECEPADGQFMMQSSKGVDDDDEE